MKPNLSTLFQKNWESNSQEAELLTRVFDTIERKQQQAIRTQKIIWSLSSVLFFAITIFTGWRAISSIISSDVGNYLSLVFSDTGIALTLWRSLVISIIESLPIIGIGFFLASIYLLFWSARNYSIRSQHFAY